MLPPDKLDSLSARLAWADIEERSLIELIERAKSEDLYAEGRKGLFRYTRDVSTALLPSGAQGTASLVAREPLVVAGLPLLELILRVYDGGVTVASKVADGASLRPGDVLATLSGSVSTLLRAERVMLNFLQMLSGVATETARYVDALGLTSTRLLDTRKTTPGYRLLEKYAVGCGGGWNHRYGLYDRVMLKDNHLAVSGAEGESLESLCARAKSCYPDLVIEVEVDAMEQIPPLLEAGADVIMLDNFDDTALREAVALIGDRAATEASGGITIKRLPRIADLGLDFISTGATVHQSTWKDIGLDWS
jgi:nicotinate-nucleotide pyrophosphorylase (carboxylating)